MAEDLQPSLLIFAGGYYSNMFVPGEVDGKSEPRKLFPDANAGQPLSSPSVQLHAPGTRKTSMSLEAKVQSTVTSKVP